MRLVFFLLVLANLVFYVWSAGYFGGQEEGREPQRLQNLLQPEKMRVTPIPEPLAPAAQSPASPEGATPVAPATTPDAAPALAPASPPQGSPAPALPAPNPPVSAPTSSVSAAPPPVAVAPSAICRRVEGVAVKDGDALQQSLKKAGFTVASLSADERSYWVHIPGLATSASAEKKAGELKQMGVGDFHVMQATGGGFVISLGLFREEALANQFLQTLGKKGVKSARLETRTKPPASLRLELRGPADLFARRLPALLTAASGVKTVECP